MNAIHPDLSADTQALKRYLVCLRICSFEQPPFRKNDIYWERQPWPKFGGYSNGVISGWGWFDPIQLVSAVSKDDAALALEEYHHAKWLSDSEYVFWMSLLE